MKISRNIYCNECRGSGAKDGKFNTCPVCKGQGVTMQRVTMGFGMQMNMQAPCNKCRGKGKTMAKKCSHCRGGRLVKDDKNIEVTIEKGMANGDHIVIEKEAEQVPDMARGDLIFIIKQQSHPTFKRVGDNLFIDMKINMKEALLGFSKMVKHLDGHYVTVKAVEGEVIQPD